MESWKPSGGRLDAGDSLPVDGNASTQRNPPGIAVVLSLLDPGLHGSVLGSSWTVDRGTGWKAGPGEGGEEAVAWQEIVACREDSAGGSLGDQGVLEKATEAGALIWVRCL